MKLIIMRHGETIENAKHIMMGHRHGTLSRKGKMQARKLALKLRDQKIDAIFSSDLRRAMDTTKEIARYHKVPIFYTKALREQNYGIFQGRALEELMAAQKKGAVGSGFDFKPQGGESQVDLRRRVKRFVRRLEAKYKGKTVLISAHAGVVWSLYSIYGHEPIGRLIKMKPRNTGTLIILVEKGKSRILKNDMF